MHQKHDLNLIRDRLAGSFNASLRGEGGAAFVFATANGRAVEISAHEDGGLWLEFWEAGADENGGAVKELLVGDDTEAIEQAKNWLR